MNQPSDLTFSFAEFTFDVARQRLIANGEPVPLSSKTAAILSLFLSRPGELITKEELFNHIWRDTIVEENNLTVQISALRKALGDNPASPRFILTVPGSGYRFVEPVLSPPQQSPTPASEALQPAQHLSARSRWLIPLLAGCLMLVVAAAWILAKRSSTEKITSLAILPFRLLDGQEEDRYLSVGLADALITRLASAPGLAVRPTNSVLHFADSDSRAAGAALGVDAVLEGHVQKRGDTLRVTVQLIRTRDGRSLWAEQFEEQYVLLFDVEDVIANNIAAKLPYLSSSSAAANHNLAAYRDYLRGRYYAKQFNAQDFRRSLDYFQLAIHEDPAYALAYAGLGEAYYEASNLLLPPQEAMPKARSAAQSALTIDPNLAEAHVVKGLVASKFDWDWPAARSEFDRALSIHPHLASAHLYRGLLSAQAADFDSALADLRSALAEDPLDSDIEAYAGTVLYWAQRPAEAEPHCRKAIELDPNLFAAHLCLGWVLQQQDRSPQALPSFEKARSLNDTAFTRLELARAQVLAKVTTAPPSREDVTASPYEAAAYFAARGDLKEVFSSLDRAYTTKAEWMSYLKVDPQLEPARPQPAFQSLLRTLHLQ